MDKRYSNTIPDMNGDNKLDWKDYLIYFGSLSLNIVFTIINILK